MRVHLSFVGIANTTLMMNSYFRFAQISDKKQLKRLYKQEHYSAGFKGFDTAYGVFNNEQLISALIVSQLTPDNTQALLHGLVTEKSRQNQGHASKLLSYCLASYQKVGLTSIAGTTTNNTKAIESIVCFIDPKLRAFYLQHQFTEQPITALNDTLKPRFNAYQKYQADLLIMVRHVQHTSNF